MGKKTNKKPFTLDNQSSSFNPFFSTGSMLQSIEFQPNSLQYSNGDDSQKIFSGSLQRKVSEKIKYFDDPIEKEKREGVNSIFQDKVGIDKISDRKKRTKNKTTEKLEPQIQQQVMQTRKKINSVDKKEEQYIEQQYFSQSPSISSDESYDEEEDRKRKISRKRSKKISNQKNILKAYKKRILQFFSRDNTVMENSQLEKFISSSPTLKSFTELFNIKECEQPLNEMFRSRFLSREILLNRAKQGKNHSYLKKIAVLKNGFKRKKLRRIM